MTKEQAIERLKEFCKLRAFCELYPDACQKDKCEIYMAIKALSEPSRQGQRDGLISRQDAIDAINGLIDRFERILRDIRESNVDESVCGMCEYDGAYMGQSGDWCNECPGFEKDDCFKLSDKTRKEWTDEIIKALPTVQPERKKGEWSDGYRWQRCSLCKQTGKKSWNYCPNCGADMRGEQNG